LSPPASRPSWLRRLGGTLGRACVGNEVAYDYLINAVGSRAATPTVAGAADFAVSFAEFECAELLRSKLDALPLDAPVTVVGGGLTGIETAADLTEQHRNVTLVCGGTLAPTFSPRACRHITTG
jgi:NADH dehydrogenase